MHQRLTSRFAVCIPLFVSTVVGLAGCSLAPTYRRPEAIVPATLSADNAPQHSADPAPAAVLTRDELRYLKTFSPNDDLAPLVSRVLSHNADFQVALHQVGEAREQYRIERSGQLPTLGMSAELQRQHFDNTALDERYGQYFAFANVGIENYELDLLGKRKSLSDAAYHRFIASDFERQTARGALIAETLRAFTLERVAAETQACLEDIDTDKAKLLEFAIRRNEIGLISKDDLDDIRRQTDEAHVRALRAADQHRASLRALRMLAGYQPISVGSGSAATLASSNASSLESFRSLDSQTLLQRPDIQQAESELRARNADIGAARAAFFPSIRLTTALGVASSGLSGLFDSTGRQWLFTPQISLPIFDFGRNRTNLRLAELRKEESVAAYEKTIQQAFREVADALDAHTTLSIAEAAERERVDREAQRVGRTDVRQAHGIEDRETLLTARIQLNEIRLTYLGIARDLVLNKIALFQAFYGVNLPVPL